MIELLQSMGCWPPDLFRNPVQHLIEELAPIVAYPVKDSESEVDLLGDLRRRLRSLQHELDENDGHNTSFHELFMKGRFGDVFDQFWSSKARNETFSVEDKNIAAWSSIMLGKSLANQAKHSKGDGARQMFAAATEKYKAALTINPNSHEALSNWGNLLFEQAVHESEEEPLFLLSAAAKKYEAALAIKPDKSETLNNWGNALFEAARYVENRGAEYGGTYQLLSTAEKKYRAALSIKPDNHQALQNLAVLLSTNARRADADEAALLFQSAESKFRAAFEVGFDTDEVLYNWAILFSTRRREQAAIRLHVYSQRHPQSIKKRLQSSTIKKTLYTTGASRSSSK